MKSKVAHLLPASGFPPEVLEVLKRHIESSDRLSAVLEQFALDNKWVEPDVVARELGLKPGQLRDRIKSGFFAYGLHYINVSHGEKPVYRYSLGEIKKLYATPPEYRKSFK